MYDNLHDAVQALDNSLIRYKKQVVFVKSCSGEDPVMLHCVNFNGKAIDIPVNDPNINVKSPNLGYTNYPSKAHYIIRKPVRRWKQGIDRQSIDAYPQAMRGECLISAPLVDTIENKYPSFKQCCELVDVPGIESRAFSREFAIRNDSALLHKGETIGLFDKERNQCRLYKKYSHLREILNKRKQG